jgi:hypothetical protein
VARNLRNVNNGIKWQIALPLTRWFGASGGAAPQKRQCEFGSFAPARAAVSRRLRQAALALCESGAQNFRETLRNLTTLLLIDFL